MTPLGLQAVVVYTTQVGTARATGVRPLQVEVQPTAGAPLRPEGIPLSGVLPLPQAVQEPTDGH